MRKANRGTTYWVSPKAITPSMIKTLGIMTESIMLSLAIWPIMLSVIFPKNAVMLKAPDSRDKDTSLLLHGVDKYEVENV